MIMLNFTEFMLMIKMICYEYLHNVQLHRRKEWITNTTSFIVLFSQCGCVVAHKTNSLSWDTHCISRTIEHYVINVIHETFVVDQLNTQRCFMENNQNNN